MRSRPVVEVLHVLGTAQQEGAGPAGLVKTLAIGLDRRRFRVSVWFLGSDGPLAAEMERHADVRVLEWEGVTDLLGTLRAWRALRARRFAIVHQHMGGRFAQWVLRAATGGRLIAHLHSAVSEGRGPSPARALAHNADEVVATSRYVAERARREAGAEARVIYPCAPHVNQEVVGGRTARSAEDGLVIGAAGRLVALKGVEGLIRAFAMVRESSPTARLEIAGTGPLLAHLQLVATGLDLGDAVTFLGWRHALRDALAGWDVFCSASLEEGFGIAVLEAMAHGLPVVAANAGGLSELVDDGRTGLLVPPSDSAALAAALGRVLANPELRAALGGAARVRASSTFSAERYLRDVESLYESLLGRSGEGDRGLPSA